MTNLFSEQISPFYRQLIDWQNLENCPLAKMILISEKEKNVLKEEKTDPIGDKVDEVLPGLIHRYPTKALLIFNHTCAGHCRFCFRRESDLLHKETALQWKKIGLYLQKHQEINELILSGGDPLLAGQQKIAALKEMVVAQKQLLTIRYHSRLPVFAPESLTVNQLTKFFSFADKKVILVIHLNHPKEISPAFIQLIKKVQKNFPQVQLKTQTVLLKGVNDEAKTLADLCKRLVELKIEPYRLYHLDQAPGISHFRLSIEEGLKLYQQLQKQLPKKDLFTYYLDLPAGKGKVPVTSLKKIGENKYLALNHHSEEIVYDDLI